MNPIEGTIRSFIADTFFVRDPASFSSDASLLDHGIVDSTGVLEVTAFLESCFDIRIHDNEIVPENLDTIDNIVGFVERKRAGQAA